MVNLSHVRHVWRLHNKALATRGLKHLTFLSFIYYLYVR